MINLRLDSLNQSFKQPINRVPSYFNQYLLFFICLFIVFKLFNGYTGDFRPQGVHFWAQADRFSIARNYYDNGLNFFKPQTNFLEKSDGLTGVEFPIVQFLVAVIAKPFGARDHLFLIYRLLSFLILSIGLQFLLKTVKINGGNGFQQILIPVFFLLSPVLLFYGFNLIPDTSSLAIVLISYYYFEAFRLKLNFKAIYYALIWGSIAALLKITSALFPVAYITWAVLYAIFIDKLITRKQILNMLGVFALALLMSLGINYYFTVMANAKYGSTVFLSTSRHINQWTDFSDIWENVVCWHREYFRETQYWVILVAFLYSMFTIRRLKEILLFKGILLLGTACFILLMGKQLMNHDYYAICTLIPVMLMLSIDGLMMLTTGCFGSLILLYIVQNLAPYSLKQAKLRQADVYNIPCREIWDFKTYMIEGSEWVESKKIPKSSVIFVLYDYPLNTPLVYLDRKGMVFNHQKMKEQELLDQWLKTLKPNYLLVPAQWDNEFKTDRPDLVNEWKLIHLGKSICIYAKE